MRAVEGASGFHMRPERGRRQEGHGGGDSRGERRREGQLAGLASDVGRRQGAGKRGKAREGGSVARKRSSNGIFSGGRSNGGGSRVGLIASRLVLTFLQD